MSNLAKHVHKSIQISCMNFTTETLKNYIFQSKSYDLPYDIWIHRDTQHHIYIIEILIQFHTDSIKTLLKQLKQLSVPDDLQDVLSFMLKHHIKYSFINDIELYDHKNKADIAELIEFNPFLPFYYDDTCIYQPKSDKTNTGIKDKTSKPICINDCIYTNQNMYLVTSNNSNDIYYVNIMPNETTDIHPISDLIPENTKNLTYDV